MIEYPENKPNISGYYFTYYYNVVEEKFFYKALSYDASKDIWIWRTPAIVYLYDKDSCAKYYTECLEKVGFYK